MKIRPIRHPLSFTPFIFAILSTACGGGGGTGPAESGVAPSTPPSALVVSTTSLPGVLQGQPYMQTIQATGGTLPYSWSVVTNMGDFPPGMSLSSSGILSGTAPQANEYLIVVQVKDSGSPPQIATSGRITFTVAAPLTITQGAPFPTAVNVGTSFTEFEFSSGGIGPFSWSLQVGSGPMPPGWSITSNVLNGSESILGGMATSSGNYNFTIQVSDPGPPVQTATRAYSVTI